MPISSPGASTLAAQLRAPGVGAARQNYMDTIRKFQDSNKAINPNARTGNQNTVGVATQSSAQAASGSGVVQQQQIKNLQGQQASNRTTDIVQGAANQRKAVEFANQAARQDAVGFSDPEAQEYAKTYKVGDPNAARQKVVREAMGLLGTGYAWGGGGYGNRSSRGTGKGTQNVIGVDCSGLTSYAYSTLGIRLPRQSDQQLRSTGYKTKVQNLRPGDLVGWARGGHVAMYIGNGQIIESPKPGGHVRIRTLGSGDSRAGVYGVALRLGDD